MPKSPSTGQQLRPLKAKQRKFTEVWVETGDAKEACRQSGYSEHYSQELTAHAGILKYKAELEAKSTAKAVKKLAITKEDWLAHLWELSHTPIEKTNGNIAGQVKAAAEYGEGAGFKVKLSADLTARFDGWTEAELEEYAKTGKRPDGK